MPYASQVSKLVTIDGLSRPEAERQVRDILHAEALAEDAAR